MRETRQREGRCLCGAVRYRVSGEPLGINLCHCEQCRRANGTAFAANGAWPADRFHVLSGSDALTAYESSPGKRRHFCRRCGSPIHSSYADGRDVVYVRIGTLAGDDDGLVADVHIHVAEQAPWHTIGDDLPQRTEQEDLWF